MPRTRRTLDGEDGGDEGAGSSGNKESAFLNHEIVQETRSMSTPHRRFRSQFPGKAALGVSPVKMLGGREGNYSGRGRFSAGDCCHLMNRYLPVNGPSVVDQMTSSAYISQFSEDGSILVAGFQESLIRLYDVERGWKVKKNIHARNLRWTITDTSLSPDRNYLVYASINPVVHIVDVRSATRDSLANVTEIHEGLDFSSNPADHTAYSFGIFSVKFSKDGRELVAGSSDESIYVYDLQENKVSLRIPAHESDVNAVCFADETGHLIYSGSDDSLCKVWDRRCLGREKFAGVLIGHVEGVTFIDTRGDGRYLISNGKDQCIKLWDIRKMSSNANYRQKPRRIEWDYRWMDYPLPYRNKKNHDDLSVNTYKGHKVLKTLIRCYFSPAHSTGQKYIYTGCSDASVHIYDLVSGERVSRLDFHEGPVRDCNWHPYLPMLISSSWDASIASWEFPGKGADPMPVKRPRSRPSRRFTQDLLA